MFFNKTNKDVLLIIIFFLSTLGQSGAAKTNELAKVKVARILTWENYIAPEILKLIQLEGFDLVASEIWCLVPFNLV